MGTVLEQNQGETQKPMKATGLTKQKDRGESSPCYDQGNHGIRDVMKGKGKNCEGRGVESGRGWWGGRKRRKGT